MGRLEREVLNGTNDRFVQVSIHARRTNVCVCVWRAVPHVYLFIFFPCREPPIHHPLPRYRFNLFFVAGFVDITSCCGVVHTFVQWMGNGNRSAAEKVCCALVEGWDMGRR